MFRIIFLLLFSFSLKAQAVYKTPSGGKYHTAVCRFVNNVSEKITEAQAKESGLQPCKICKPQDVHTQSNLTAAHQAQGQAETMQCKGITKAGTRCRHKTRIANGYCFQHNPDKE